MQCKICEIITDLLLLAQVFHLSGINSVVSGPCELYLYPSRTVRLKLHRVLIVRWMNAVHYWITKLSQKLPCRALLQNTLTFYEVGQVTTTTVLHYEKYVSVVPLSIYTRKNIQSLLWLKLWNHLCWAWASHSKLDYLKVNQFHNMLVIKIFHDTYLH